MGMEATSWAGNYLTSLTPQRQNETAQVIREFVTEERLFGALLALQDQAFSGTVMVQRAPVVRDLLRKMNVPTGSFDSDTCETRQPSVNLTNGRKRVVVVAHGDTVSYGVGQKLDGDDYAVVPFCAHRIEPGNTFPARVIRVGDAGFEVVAGGMLGTTRAGEAYFRLDRSAPAGGFSLGTDRIVLHPPALSLDPATKILRGSIDNPAGMAVAIVMLGALAEVARTAGRPFEDLRAGVLFTDWEEGLPGEQAFFARGMRLYINRAQGSLPRMAVVIDGHNQDPPGGAALLGSVSGRGRGAIVPPDVYAGTISFLRHCRIPVTETPNWGPPATTISRSDDAAAIEAFSVVIPLGYGAANPHADHGAPMANLEGLSNTAQAVAFAVLQYAGFE